MVYKSRLSHTYSTLIKGQWSYKQASLILLAAATTDDIHQLWSALDYPNEKSKCFVAWRTIQNQDLFLSSLYLASKAPIPLDLHPQKLHPASWHHGNVPVHSENLVCGLIYLWKEIVLSKITESEIFNSTRFVFLLKRGGGDFFWSSLNKQDEYCFSFQGAKTNAKHSWEYWLVGNRVKT